MSISFHTLNCSHLTDVDMLGSKFKKTIGFLTRDTISEYLNNQGIIGAIDSSENLLGYIMFATYPDRIRIAQLCISEDARGNGLAKNLITNLEDRVTTQKVIKLKCRRDFKANSFWPKAGFIAFDECSGKSVEGHPLTTWCKILDEKDELGLWTAQISEETLNAVIDAQIFYDFYESNSQKSRISKGLMNDYLTESLSLWINDELFNEIQRKDDRETRDLSRKRTHGFQRIEFNKERYELVVPRLRKVLPHETENQISDINQIAKTAASEVDVFVTRDTKILKLADKLNVLTGLSIVSPSTLIAQLHSSSNTSLYTPSRVCGIALQWHRLDDILLGEIAPLEFKYDFERKGRFIEILNSLIAHPNENRCECLKSDGQIVAIRVLSLMQDGSISINLCRTINSKDSVTLMSFIITDTIDHAVANRVPSVFISSETLETAMLPILTKLHFLEAPTGFLKPTITQIGPRHDLVKSINSSSKNAFSEDLLDLYQLDKVCFPAISNSDIPCFLIPIKPTYAMRMIDRTESSNDLFGGNSTTLLRADNVYYRKKTHHKMLRAPGIILWYVSGSIGEVIAISYLDKVESDRPKKLFKKYSKFGVLEWKDLYQICDQNIEKEIMCLRFSSTYSFRNRIPYATLTQICKSNHLNLPLPSPCLIDYHTLRDIYNLGFSIKP